MLLIQLSSTHSNNKLGHTGLGSRQSQSIPLPSLHGGEGSSFSGLAASSDMVDSESVGMHSTG